MKFIKSLVRRAKVKKKKKKRGLDILHLTPLKST